MGTEADILAGWKAELYAAGDLSWKLLDHQVEDYNAFRAWNVDRQTPEHIAINRQAGATYHNVWVDEIGRRWGKTSKALVVELEEAIQRPNSRSMIFTPLQKSIGGIIVPLTKILFADAPDEYFPHYRTTKSGSHQGLEVKATESWTKLVGVDKHSDALRGEFLDRCIGTEAAFVRGSVKEGSLAEIIQGTIQPQFRYRPWGFVLLESSTAKQPDHDFNSVFREDAQLRRRAHGERKMWCFRTHTIDEVTNMTPEEIEIELDQSGGRNHPKVRREYFCEEIRDPEDTIVPEFDAPTKARPHTAHVVPAGSPVPRYAMAYVGMDPGFRDPLGLLWGYVDFERNKLVIQADFAELNCSLERASTVMRETESGLWFTEHRKPGDRSVPMLSIRDALKTTVDELVWKAPTPALTYWQHETLKPNPYRRISDVAPQFLSELAAKHAINFEATAKDDADAQLHALRLGFSQNRIEIWDTCQHLIRQLRSGVWNELRTEWERTPTLGHCDCIAALIYMWRNIDWRLNPFPPARIDPTLYDVAIPVGVDKNSATGRQNNAAETRFRETRAVRKWR